MGDDMDIPMPSMMPAGATWRNVRRREGLDGMSRRLVLFAGVIGGGLLLLVGIWSLTGHRSTTVPVVEADTRPLRTKPENRGGLQLAGQDDAITSGGGGGQDGMAPPPELPAPEALREAAATPPAILARPASDTPEPKVSAAPPAAAVVAVPPSRPAAAAPPAPTEPAARTLPPSVAARASGAQVQLAALVTEDSARAEWQRLLRRAPELLGGRAPIVTKLERGDGKVFWRLRTGGFSDIAQATTFCGQLRARGLSCTLEAR